MHSLGLARKVTTVDPPMAAIHFDYFRKLAREGQVVVSCGGLVNWVPFYQVVLQDMTRMGNGQESYQFLIYRPMLWFVRHVDCAVGQACPAVSWRVLSMSDKVSSLNLHSS